MDVHAKFHRTKTAISTWYQGTYTPYENLPGSPLIFVGGDYHRHWTARAARAIVEFIAREWKWIIGTGVAIAAVFGKPYF